MSRREPSTVDALPPGSAAASFAHEPVAVWRFHVLVEIGNFAALRRRLGRGRSELLGGDVADLLRDSIPGALVAVVSLL